MGPQFAAAWATLSARQQSVAEHVARGLTSKQIARALAISPLTVRKHRTNIFAALAVHSVAELARQLSLGRSSTPSE